MPNPPNPTNRFSLKALLLFSPLIILYIMVLFGFFIRENIPFEDHFLFPWLFMVFFVLFLVKVSAMTGFLKMENFFAVGFFIVNVLLLYFNSSIKREYEISHYVERNEKELLAMVNHHQQHGEDSTFHAMRADMNITLVEFVKGNYDFRLYRFLGYGYGLTYTDSLNLNAPKTTSGGCPIIKWIKVKEHWYYYSYFD
jgi:hypothetical protein